MKKFPNYVLLLICLLLLIACSEKSQSVEKIDSFSFTDQSGHPFGTDDLKDKVWIANFIFTKCDTICPTMTAEIASLQKRFIEKGIPVEFISFSVDPTVDSPAVLKTYIQRFTDDETNWHLLTGYKQQEIEKFAREQFQTIVQKPNSSTQVLHGTNFYLVNKQGVLVNEYNFVDSSYVDTLIKDIENELK
ncbi:SCO family protein [Filibacter tadaridae]|uniref:Thioredoxin domain-containing protein n=1 Tax=Filibacter tadaridae TaxID=2483811 RepID=A0A3P5XP99_9BACL|nr:SCO family protein [Filibacter tadaridae]VDC33533.1 hypothetical protein FILTAD_02943 [Filibacter tadaridae]